MSTRTQALLWGGLAVLLPIGFSSLAIGTAAAAPARAKPAPKPTPPPAAAPAATPAAAPAPAPADGAAAGRATPAAAKPSDAPAAAPTQLQEETGGPKEEAARAHYSRAVEQYLQGNYANAWLEFSSAYQIKPLTALLNNMARCEVKIGRPVEALQHFRRFLAATPDDPDAEYIKQEIARLEAELGRRAAPSQTDAALGGTDPSKPMTPPRRIPVYSIAAGATTVAALIAGAATLGSVAARYSSLETACKPGCPPLDVVNLQQQSYAGYGLLGAAVVPAILTIVALRFELGRPAETTLRPLAGLRLTSPLYVFGSN